MDDAVGPAGDVAEEVATATGDLKVISYFNNKSEWMM